MTLFDIKNKLKESLGFKLDIKQGILTTREGSVR
jgi:hypothetical protein